MAGREIRSEIAAQHAELKHLLEEVDALAKRFERSDGDDPAVGAELHERGLTLFEKFRAHVDREQELLTPAFREAGAEGERWASRLAHEHDEQRQLLAYLVGRLERHPEPTLLIARELQHFADFLRLEMVHEEESILSPTLLGETHD